jgi:high-affinity K+ transport system ATPase subunit B
LARRYAAILANIAMTVVVLRAWKNGVNLEAAAVSALFWTALLATIGGLVGAVAQATIDESVRQRIEQELAAANEPPLAA